MKGNLLRTLPVAALLTISLAAPAAAAVINGTNGPDVLVGTAQADVIHAYGAADTVYGKAGADLIYAGRDNKRDKVYGGSGPDRIFVRLADTVHAGRGNDVVKVSVSKWGMTRIFCGPGYDRLYTSVGGSGAGEPDNATGWLFSYRSCEEVY